MTTVIIKTRKAAEHLLRWTAKLPAGTGNWSDARWIAEANRHAARLAPDHAAAVLRGFNSRHATFAGVVCRKCGAHLTAPESVAAGVGPECMAA